VHQIGVLLQQHALGTVGDVGVRVTVPPCGSLDQPAGRSG